MRSDQFLDRIRRLIHGAANPWESSVEVRKLLANGVLKLGISEPGNVVKVGWNARRLFDVVSNNNAVASFKAVADFVEQAGLHELVRSGLQISAANLRAEHETSQRRNLGFKEMFLAFNANFAQGCRQVVSGLRQRRTSSRGQQQQQSGAGDSEIAQHRPILAKLHSIQIRGDYSTVTDFARLRG